MRTATTIHLVNGEWVCLHGPADVPAKNGLPADQQRALAQDVTKWPKESAACLIHYSDGRAKKYFRSEAESVGARSQAFRERAEMKAEMAKEIEAKRQAEIKAKAEAAAKQAAELNAKNIADKEAFKARVVSERETAEAARVQPAKTKTK